MALSYLDTHLVQLPCSEMSLIKVEGADIIRFFNGHTTIDLEKLEINQAKLSSKTDRTGRLLFAFYLLKAQTHFYLICKKTDVEALISEFDKFIIMDDVSLKLSEESIAILVGAQINNKYTQAKNRFKANLLGYPSLFLIDESSVSEDFINNDLQKEFILKSGSVFFEKDFPAGSIINSTLYMNEVDLEKGCYIGQETIKKIANNRGAASFPCLLKIPKDSVLPPEIKIKDKAYSDYKKFSDENHTYLVLSLPRELRVDQGSLTIDTSPEISASVHNLPLSKKQSSQEIAQRVYVEAVKLFQQSNEEKAEQYFRLGISIDPSHSDLVESLGVQLGRNNKFQEAIDLMDELLKINPESVMAHTNKSLYLMKLGKIEEAEEEKALATVNSFKALGKEASAKKLIEEENNKKMADRERKESMFKQVLEIDNEDIIANFGLGEISFERKEYSLSESFLLQAIKTDPKHSRAYSVLGKVYEALDQLDKAIETYKKGIEVASQKGEMMPANEMQSRLLLVQRIM
jgi:tetratricopeptide (TPR) repeat protein